jgi:hypothetical protein
MVTYIFCCISYYGYTNLGWLAGWLNDQCLITWTASACQTATDNSQADEWGTHNEEMVKTEIKIGGSFLILIGLWTWSAEQYLHIAFSNIWFYLQNLCVASAALSTKVQTFIYDIRYQPNGPTFIVEFCPSNWDPNHHSHLQASSSSTSTYLWK